MSRAIGMQYTAHMQNGRMAEVQLCEKSSKGGKCKMVGIKLKEDEPLQALFMGS